MTVKNTGPVEKSLGVQGVLVVTNRNYTKLKPDIEVDVTPLRVGPGEVGRVRLGPFDIKHPALVHEVIVSLPMPTPAPGMLEVMKLHAKVRFPPGTDD